MTDKTLLAARNNAHWCDIVCRADGIPTKWGDQAWMSLRRSPRFYPDLVTLTRGKTVDLELVDASAGCSIKDSFACVEPDGFEVLFDAEWIWHDAPELAEPRLTWRRTPHLSPEVFVMETDDGGAILNISDGVVGVSNVHGAVWSDLTAMIAAQCPGLPLVGYEHGEDLEHAVAAGFQPIGPLRIWMKG